jgi:hypothetical protein
MKKILIVISLFFCFRIYAFNLLEYFDARSYHYILNSYIGSDYFPDRDENEFSYLEKINFKIGCEYIIQQNSSLWMDLSYRNDLFDKKVILERTGISTTRGSWEFIYKFDRIEIGKRSYILNRNVYGIHFDKGVIENYRFNGLQINHNMNRFALSGKIGGNNFNTSVGMLSVDFSNDNGNFEFYYLYCGRDRLLNMPMHAFGSEFIQDFRFISIYNSTVYEYMHAYDFTHNTRERFANLSEIIIQPTDSFSFGSNFLYEFFDWETDKEWQSQFFLELKYNNFTNYASYRYWKADIGFDREVNIINSYKILPQWSVATNLSYFNPSSGTDYYLLGFQVQIAYEID